MMQKLKEDHLNRGQKNYRADLRHDEVGSGAKDFLRLVSIERFNDRIQEYFDEIV